MKGSALVWVMVLIGIFVVSLMYILFSSVIYTHIAPTVYNELTVTNTTDTTQAIATYNLIELVWSWWPLILIVGLIMIGFVSAQRREPDEFYY